MIENMARLDPDEVTQWESFTRLVREGRTVDDIAATFGLPDLTVRRVLALGNLLPRIRALYAKEEIDRTTVRHLTLASKSQQKSWLALHDDPKGYAPTGQHLKSWLFGGQSIPARHALFDLDSYPGQTVADLFGEDRFFADPGAFWKAQDAAIEARRAAYIEDGWADAVVVPPSEHFQSWEYEKTAKRKGGRVYIDVRASGEVVCHEGYLTRREASKAAAPETAGTGEKAARPELTSGLQAYVDLHRHAAVRAALTGHPQVALRLMVAHAVAGSSLWHVRCEPQAARDDTTRESVENARGEAVFDERRRAVLGLLGFAAEEPTVTGGDAGEHGLLTLFARLLDLPDAAVLDVAAIVMGETLASGGDAVEMVGDRIGVDMATWWQADDALFDLIRDKQVLAGIVAEVAGRTVADANANAREKGATLKRIVRDHLDGTGGRDAVTGWVPRWMAFPPSAYTARGGVGSVAARARVEAAQVEREDPDPGAPGAAALSGAANDDGTMDRDGAPEQLAA